MKEIDHGSRESADSNTAQGSKELGRCVKVSKDTIKGFGKHLGLFQLMNSTDYICLLDSQTFWIQCL